MEYARYIRDVPDFPQPGVLFRDITPLLQSADVYRQAIQDMCAPFRDRGIDQVVAIEARGYLLGAPMALELGAGLVLVRKEGKLPFHTYRVDYALEYGQATMEMHQDGLLAHHKVLIVDDVLATGGTMAATVQLVERSQATVAGIAVLIELEELAGREKTGDHSVFSLMRM